MSIPLYLLTDFTCCEDFEKFLRSQNHANRKLLDALTEQVVVEWNRKACNLAIMGSNICLLDKDGVTLATVPALLQDDDTITRDNLTGTIKCVRIVAQGANHSIGVWIGTHEQYKALKDKNHQKTAYFFTDVNLSDVYEDLLTVKNWMLSVKNGTASVKYANEAQYADHAGSATYATNADYATASGTADLAKKATNADFASNAGNSSIALHATYAEEASKAATADKATNADYASSAVNATTALNATYAGEASKAGKATNDSSGNKFESTYGNFSEEFKSYVEQTLTTGTYQVTTKTGISGGYNQTVSVLLYFTEEEATGVNVILSYLYEKNDKKYFLMVKDRHFYVVTDFYSADSYTLVSASIKYRKIL